MDSLQLKKLESLTKSIVQLHHRLSVTCTLENELPVTELLVSMQYAIVHRHFNVHLRVVEIRAI